jgi:two-component system LytT family response regulator
MSLLRAVIVDDEPPARELLRDYLLDEPGIEIVAECGTAQEAIAAVTRERPDLVFLDVRLPDGTGFEVVRAMPGNAAVIFVTAYHDYAVRAFEVDAFDYLLKPFDRERLREAIARARSRLATGPPEQLGPQLAALLQRLGAERPRHLAIRSHDRAFFVAVDEIDWLEAHGKLVRIHVPRGTHDMRITLSRFEGLLDPTQFLRLSRSAIVNVDRIREVQAWFQGDRVVVLRDGTRLTSTRGYRDNLRRLLDT